MLQPSSDSSQGLPLDDPASLRPVRLPARLDAYSPPDLPAKPRVRAARAGQGRIRRHALRQVLVLEVTGQLRDVVEELDRAVQLALAEGPRGVVCDLSAVTEGADPVSVEVLATAGRHVRDWPGIPVAVASMDPQVHDGLRASSLGGHLIVTASLFSAITSVLARPALTVQCHRLAPHPTAPRAARNFVTRTLLDWQLSRVIPFASLVVSELVASSTVHAGTDIDLSVAWHLGALRLTVRDRGPALADQRPRRLELYGREFTVVAGLSRAFGVLPTADGGKVVWAVLEAPRLRPSTRRTRSENVTPTQESPVFTDGRGMAKLPFCAGPGRQPT